ncbi:MAG: hypothetical protein WC511_01725 [Candidatus Pacearchaeota archaeon]
MSKTTLTAKDKLEIRKVVSCVSSFIKGMNARHPELSGRVYKPELWFWDMYFFSNVHTEDFVEKLQSLDFYTEEELMNGGDK